MLLEWRPQEARKAATKGRPGFQPPGHQPPVFFPEKDTSLGQTPGSMTADWRLGQGRGAVVYEEKTLHGSSGPGFWGGSEQEASPPWASISPAVCVCVWRGAVMTPILLILWI